MSCELIRMWCTVPQVNSCKLDTSCANGRPHSWDKVIEEAVERCLRRPLSQLRCTGLAPCPQPLLLSMRCSINFPTGVATCVVDMMWKLSIDICPQLGSLLALNLLFDILYRYSFIENNYSCIHLHTQTQTDRQTDRWMDGWIDR